MYKYVRDYTHMPLAVTVAVYNSRTVPAVLARESCFEIDTVTAIYWQVYWPQNKYSTTPLPYYLEYLSYAISEPEITVGP